MALKADMKILVVDDMATMRKIIKNMLSQIGFTKITEADDGATAWPLLEQAKESGLVHGYVPDHSNEESIEAQVDYIIAETLAKME